MKKTCVPSFKTAALTVVLILALAACAGQPPAASPSHVRLVEGTATVTTVLEDFDQGKPAVALVPRIDAWGARIGATRSSSGTVPGASPDGGSAARFVFEAAFDSPYAPGPSWEDSGLAFVSRVDLGTPPEASEGLSVRMKPEGFTVLELYLVQGRASKPNVYGLTVFATDGAWKEWKVPFASFRPMESAPPFDPARPVALEVYAPFDGNWNAFSFRKGDGAAGSLLVDEIYHGLVYEGHAHSMLEFTDRCIVFNGFSTGTAPYNTSTFAFEINSCFCGGTTTSSSPTVMPERVA